MSEKINLNEMERRAYMAYHQDGLWDIFLGLCLLGFGIAMLLDMTAFAGITPALVVPIILSLKQRITIPRLGHAKFLPERRAVERAQLVGMVILGGLVLSMIAGLLIFVMNDTLPAELYTWLKANFAPAFGGLAALALTIVALVSRVTRLLAYAALIFIAFAGGHWLNITFPVMVTVVGSGIIAIGLVILFRFLGKYPKPPDVAYYMKSNS